MQEYGTMRLLSKNIRKLRDGVRVVMLVSSLCWINRPPCDAQTNPEATPTISAYADEVAQLLQRADAYFAKQEFPVSYDLYLRVLGLEPANQPARTKIFAIINAYKTLSDAAQKESDLNQAALPYQKYRNAVRDLLQLLTTQLKRGIQQYGELVVAAKSGQDVKAEIISVLQNMRQILRDLNTIYTEFSRGDEGTAKMSARIGETIKKYEQELAGYQQ